MENEDVARARAQAIRLAAISYLTLQGGGGLVWWIMLLGWPATRAPFLATGAPESTLLALSVADLLLYVGGSWLAAGGLFAKRDWAWPAICVHAGAAAYAALYCLALWYLDPHAWIGGLVMLPSLFLPPLIAWHYRPRTRPPC